MLHFTATEIAFLMVTCQQLLLAAGWAIGARLIPTNRVAALHWCAFALSSGAALALYVVATQSGSEWPRLAGNVLFALSLVVLQRGIRRFFDAAQPRRGHAALLLATLAIATIGMAPEYHALRKTLLPGLMALLCLSIAWDLHRLAGGRSRWFGLGVAAPLVLAAIVMLGRSLRALAGPEGAVVEITADTARTFGAAFASMVLMLTSQLSLLALVISRLVADLRQSLRRDALTGLLNRRALDEVLDAELARARRLQAPFAVLMIDVDHFKRVNDRHGHAAGDRALQHLGALMASQMRDIDRLGRYGGEEFLALLPATTLAQAEIAAERLRERAAALPLAWHEGAIPLTVSVGVAAWRDADDALPAVLQRADAALYAAKAAGRNRAFTETGAASPIAIRGAPGWLATRSR